MLDRNNLNNSYRIQSYSMYLEEETEEEKPFVRRVFMFMFVEDKAKKIFFFSKN